MSERIEEFTAGPWEVGRDGRRVNAAGVVGSIAVTYGPEGETEAVAKLIAATPTLYAALVSVVVDWHLDHGDPIDGPEGTLVNPPKPEPIEEAEIAICDALLGPRAGLRARCELIELIVWRGRQEFEAAFSAAPVAQADGAV